jgi:hypothetical protein
MRSNPPPAVTWGGCHVPSKTPLMRAAVVGGGAYVAGRSVARRSAEVEQQETEQDERLDNLEQQAPAIPAQEAPAAAPSMPDQLNQLAALHEQGADRRRIRRCQGQVAWRLGAGRSPNLDPGNPGLLKEHRMSKPFKGTINVDIRDSVPDWAPFQGPGKVMN